MLVPCNWFCGSGNWVWFCELIAGSVRLGLRTETGDSRAKIKTKQMLAHYDMVRRNEKLGCQK